MDCDVSYIIGKILERKYLKWDRIAHLDIWDTSYGQKKGHESNWQFDSRPQKVRNRPDFCVWRWHVTYRWKALNERYNFALDLISIRGLHVKLWRPKVTWVPTLAISGLPLGNLGTKSYLDVGPVEKCKVYYKGEGDGFPQVRPVVSLVCPCCPWVVLAPKVLQLRINNLVWVLCKPMWVSEACQLFLVPSRSFSTPLYPSKCCELRSMPRLLLLLLFSTWTHIWVFQGVGSASINVHHQLAKCWDVYYCVNHSNNYCLQCNMTMLLNQPSIWFNPFKLSLQQYIKITFAWVFCSFSTWWDFPLGIQFQYLNM
jgi:hypothetical protein